jgi:hypothetical protein
MRVASQTSKHLRAQYGGARAKARRDAANMKPHTPGRRDAYAIAPPTFPQARVSISFGFVHHTGPQAYPNTGGLVPLFGIVDVGGPYPAQDSVVRHDHSP